MLIHLRFFCIRRRLSTVSATKIKNLLAPHILCAGAKRFGFLRSTRLPDAFTNTSFAAVFPDPGEQSFL
jgi:hypothetical protein